MRNSGPWTTWAIAYNQMDRETGTGDVVDFNHINDLYLGMGTRCQPFNFGGGEGNVMFDDIRVLASTCVWMKARCRLDGNCIVDVRNLDIMANDWLQHREQRFIIRGTTSMLVQIR
jgi:hypothetical protein